jgi:hypothetical protein
MNPNFTCRKEIIILPVSEVEVNKFNLIYNEYLTAILFVGEVAVATDGQEHNFLHSIYSRLMCK